MEENYHYRDHSGQRATGIGLAAGLGGGALIGLLALAYGLNNASKARMRAAENACAGNTINTISVNACQRCGRTFVSETPLTLTVA